MDWIQLWILANQPVHLALFWFIIYYLLSFWGFDNTALRLSRPFNSWEFRETGPWTGFNISFLSILITNETINYSSQDLVLLLFVPLFFGTSFGLHFLSSEKYTVVLFNVWVFLVFCSYSLAFCCVDYLLLHVKLYQWNRTSICYSSAPFSDSSHCYFGFGRLTAFSPDFLMLLTFTMPPANFTCSWG